MITIQQVIDSLESWAHPSYQEEYDNSGLLTGSASWSVQKILVTLDCTEEVVEEALQQGCNLIVAHHPIIFRGLKRITGKTYVERTVIMAIKNDIAIYALHTNLDNVLTGVNRKIADRLGLTNQKILDPKKNVLSKLVTFVPTAHKEKVLQALYQAGAGNIGNYEACSFQLEGTGTFRATANANPFVGKVGELEQAPEIRIELILPTHLERPVVKALKAAHPYEEVAFYLTRVENEYQEVGAGMVGNLPEPMEPIEFIRRLKVEMKADVVRYTKPVKDQIKTVAVCGGSGSFLLSKAIQAGADAYVSADFKYHEFFDADNKIMVADIGHYESEQFTKELIGEVLREKFPTFAINFSKQVTNPLSYL